MAPSFVQVATSLLCVGSAWADSNYALVLDKRAAVIPSPLPGTFVYQGCYTDTGARALSGSSYTSATAMSDESCINYCNGLGYYYAGTEYSSVGSTLHCPHDPTNSIAGMLYVDAESRLIHYAEILILDCRLW